MTKQEQYEKICQKALRKHYRAFRKVVDDPFFVDCEKKGRAQLTKMLLNTRSEVEETTYIERWDMNSRRIAEHILNNYLIMGGRYGKKYYKQRLKIITKSSNGL